MSGAVDEPRSRRRFTWSELGPRLGSALVLMGVALLCTAAGGWSFAALWLAALAVVWWEWLTLVGGGDRHLAVAIGSAALALAAVLAAGGHPWPALASLLAGAAVSSFTATPRRLLCAAGVLYAGLPLLALILLRRSEPFGPAAIFWLYAVVWGTDVMAFFGGRTFGGPKLCPAISPSKTWSGFLVGIASGAALGAVVAPAGSPRLSVLGFGLVAAAVSQGGDLLESSLKRRFGAKDSGRLIPGHGGAMDRLDGFMAAACFVAAVGLARYGVEGIGRAFFE